MKSERVWDTSQQAGFEDESPAAIIENQHTGPGMQ
jgi:hypothetical protein